MTNKARKKSKTKKQKSGKRVTNGHTLFGELVKELTAEEGVTIRRYRDYLLRPDPDRNLLLTTHIIVERIIELTLETRLPAPAAWIPSADFSSKVRLARALGLIGEEEHRVCSVLNSARNALAHELEPLANKWRIEFNRLAYGSRHRSTNNRNDFAKTLIELISIVFGSCLRARFYHKRFQLREQYSDRWRELIKQKIREAWTSPDESAAALDEELLALEVDLQIARDLKHAKREK